MQIVSLKWTYNFNQQWSNQWIDLKFKGYYTGYHWFFNHKDREQPQFVPSSNSGIKPWTLASRCCCWNGHWQNAFHHNDDMTIDSWVCLKLGYPIIPFIIMFISNVLQIWGYCYSPIFKHTHSILLCTCATRSHYIPTWLLYRTISWRSRGLPQGVLGLQLCQHRQDCLSILRFTKLDGCQQQTLGFNMIQQENMETSPPKVVFSKINPVVWSNDLTKMWSSESWIWTSLDLFALQQQHRGPSALLHGQGTYPARKPRSSAAAAVYFELRSKLGVGILTTGAGGLLGRSFLRAMPNPVLTHSYSRTSPDFAVASTSHLWQRTRRVRPG